MRFILIFIAVLLCGCGVKPSAMQALTEIKAVQETTASIGTHVDSAKANVATATKTAETIPAAAPVLPPLLAATVDLTAAQDKVQVLTGQIVTVSDTSKALADRADKAEARAEKAEAGEAAWKHKYESQWFAGRFWFWFNVVWITGSIAIALLFVAEFFLGLNIHPLTFLIKGTIYAAKLAINIVKGIIGGAQSAASALVAGLKKPAALQPSTPAAPTLDATPKTGG